MMSCVGGQELKKESSSLFWGRQRGRRLFTFSRTSSSSSPLSLSHLPQFPKTSASGQVAAAIRAADVRDDAASCRDDVISLISVDEAGALSYEPLLLGPGEPKDLGRSSEASDRTATSADVGSFRSSASDLDAGNLFRLSSGGPQQDSQYASFGGIPKHHPSEAQTPLALTPGAQHASGTPKQGAAPPFLDINSTASPSRRRPCGGSSARRSSLEVSRLGVTRRPLVARCSTVTCAGEAEGQLAQCKQGVLGLLRCDSANTLVADKASAFATVPDEQCRQGPEGEPGCSGNAGNASRNSNCNSDSRSHSARESVDASFAAVFQPKKESRKTAGLEGNPFPIHSQGVHRANVGMHAVYLASQRRLGSECGSGAVSPARPVASCQGGTGYPVPGCRTATAGLRSPGRPCQVAQDAPSALDWLRGWPLGQNAELAVDAAAGVDGVRGAEGVAPTCADSLDRHRDEPLDEQWRVREGGDAVVGNPSTVCATWTRDDWRKVIQAAEVGLRFGDKLGMTAENIKATRALLSRLHSSSETEASQQSSSEDSRQHPDDLPPLDGTDSSSSTTSSQGNRTVEGIQGIATRQVAHNRPCPFKSRSDPKLGPLACPYLGGNFAEFRNLKSATEIPGPTLAASPKRDHFGERGAETHHVEMVPPEDSAGSEAFPQKLRIAEAAVEVHEMMLGGHGRVSQACWFLLDKLLECSSSGMGFIASLRRQDDGSPFLKTHAITNVGWTPELCQWYDDNREAGLVFSNMNTLFGAVVTTQNVVISNSPAGDERFSGVPPGHPAISTFLGIPLFIGGTLVGVFAAANRKAADEFSDEYSEALVEVLKPLTNVASHAISLIISQEDIADERAEVDSLADCLDF